MHFSCSQAITCYSVRDRTVRDQLSYLVDQDNKRLREIELANRNMTEKMRDFLSKINFKNISSMFTSIIKYFKKKLKQLRNYLAELMDIDVAHDSDNEDDDDNDNVQDDASHGNDHEVVDQSNDHDSKEDSSINREDKDRLILEVDSDTMNYDYSTTNDVINFNDDFSDTIT